MLNRKPFYHSFSSLCTYPFQHLQSPLRHSPDPFASSPLQREDQQITVWALIGKGQEVAKAQDGTAVLVVTVARRWTTICIIGLCI